MIPTPDLSHLTRADYDKVYEPAEDTFILLDALEAEAEQLRALDPTICLEIGSGSGCVSTFLAKLLGPSVSTSPQQPRLALQPDEPTHDLVYLSTDINAYACQCTKRTASQNQVFIEPINASFDSPLRTRLKNSVDVLLFNPPYVPTFSEEAISAQDDPGIQGAWAGGSDGMQITDVFLPHVKDLLSSRGRFYLVAVTQNDIPNIRSRMLRDHDLDSEIVLKRRAGREHLHVVRFQYRTCI